MFDFSTSQARGYRADLLYFDEQGVAQLQTDGLLVVGPDPRAVASCDVVLAWVATKM
ncbi:hypothetical protein LN050_05420 [Comamonadaceae bacterium M7527]|nr:hypothetical protein LN050_05420 [Comamonadaceae bacterium M7527]